MDVILMVVACRAAAIERLIEDGYDKRTAELALFDGVIPPDQIPALRCGCCSHCGCSC